jgi:hypothetical protein
VLLSTDSTERIASSQNERLDFVPLVNFKKDTREAKRRHLVLESHECLGLCHREQTRSLAFAKGVLRHRHLQSACFRNNDAAGEALPICAGFAKVPRAMGLYTISITGSCQ